MVSTFFGFKNLKNPKNLGSLVQVEANLNQKPQKTQNTARVGFLIRARFRTLFPIEIWRFRSDQIYTSTFLQFCASF